MNNNLLFEIGTEEIPSKYMPKTLQQAKTLTETKLNEKRIRFGEVKTYGTPRRIVILVNNISENQEDLEEMVKGPSKKAAFDGDGNPTKALLGFLKGQNTILENIQMGQLSGVDYVYAKKQEKGLPTKEVLKNILPDIMTSITFPKSMKWGNKSFRFARPIRWVMPIFNDEIIEFDKDGIPCGRITRGHRVLSKGEIEIKHTGEYFEKLKKGYVIVDQDERRELIKKQSIEVAKQKGGVAVIDEELLEEITFLVEYPTALIGNFEAEYLKLPKEAVVTPMKEHQRYFPVIDHEGKLMNHFITVRNGDDRYLDIVAQGNEKVLRARLADAKFFFDEDKKNGLDTNVEKLKHVVFQETLGTIYDKTERIKKNCESIAASLKIQDKQKANLMRAAQLSKADLVTGMVKEFTELQGIMGREYALLQGENQEVADAILEQYLPRSAGAENPKSINGAILGIADRIDTISGCFAIGIQPTGSQDPYGLRRQAIAIISIMLERKLHMSLNDLFINAYKPFEEKGIVKGNVETAKKDISEFFKGRFKNALMDKGFEYDVLDAVVGAGLDDVLDSYEKVSIISDWKKREEFKDILSSFNRVSNLAAKTIVFDINEDLLIQPQEKDLANAVYEIEEKYEDYLKSRDYENALKLLMTLKSPIDHFFDNIMVMVEDESVRNCRLALLSKIARIMNNFADLSMIVAK